MASGYMTSDGKDLDQRYLAINGKAASAVVADRANALKSPVGVRVPSAPIEASFVATIPEMNNSYGKFTFSKSYTLPFSALVSVGVELNIASYSEGQYIKCRLHINDVFIEEHRVDSAKGSEGLVIGFRKVFSAPNGTVIRIDFDADGSSRVLSAQEVLEVKAYRLEVG